MLACWYNHCNVVAYLLSSSMTSSMTSSLTSSSTSSDDVSDTYSYTALHVAVCNTLVVSVCLSLCLSVFVYVSVSKSLNEQRMRNQLPWAVTYVVYLFSFAWWQHRFNASMVNTNTHTRRLTAFDQYAMSSFS